MAIFRTAQGLAVGLGRNAAAASGNLTGTLQVPGLLQDVLIRFPLTSLGLVSAFTVSGQSVMCSNLGFDLAGLHPEAFVEGQRSLGIPLDANQVVSVDYSVAPNAIVGGSVNLDPIEKQDVIPVNQLGSQLDFLFGLGASGAIAAGGDGSLSATARRQVMLGRFGLTPSAADMLTVRSVSVNNIELLAGQSGATDEIPVECFGWFATDQDGNTLGYPVTVNGSVVVSIHNYDAAPQSVNGGIFVMPGRV